MEITELDGGESPELDVSPVLPAPAILGSNRVAPAPVDLEQGGEQPPAGTDTGAEVQLMQPPAGITTTAASSDQPQVDRDGSSSTLASKSGHKSAQEAWLDIRHDATALPHAIRQKVRLAHVRVRVTACVLTRAYPGTCTPHVYTLQVLFQYMCPDTVCVHGLRDWSVDEWARALEQQPQASAQFLKNFLGASAVNNLMNSLSTIGGSDMGGSSGADLPQQHLAAAQSVRVRMLEPLEGADWELVCQRAKSARLGGAAAGHPWPPGADSPGGWLRHHALQSCASAAQPPFGRCAASRTSSPAPRRRGTPRSAAASAAWMLPPRARRAARTSTRLSSGTTCSPATSR